MTTYFVAGHRGMVGSAVVRALKQRRSGQPAITVLTRDRSELDLSNEAAVRRSLLEMKPDVVILAAAKVGGIHANSTYPAEFIHQNMMIAANVVDGAHRAGVQRMLQFGSSCIYPRAAPQPIKEQSLLTGMLEPTNEPYAIAKIAAIKLCESYNRQYGRDYRSVMPCNLYGPGDNFNCAYSHVVPALIRRFHEAREKGASEVTIWGSGRPRREFLHVDDLARAALYVLDVPLHVHRENTRPMLSHINIGSGSDIPVRELAGMIAQIVGFRGRILTDPSKPDGTQQKLLNNSRLAAMGWRPRISLEDGLRSTYQWYVDNAADVRV
jgi:GDP-L-fucose synthase